jgi:hypothetical protein
MFIKTRISKDKKLSSGENTMAGIKDGELSILIKQPRKLQRDLTVNTDSISIDSSISDQDSQCKELLKLFLTILDSEDIPFQEEDNKPGSLIEFRIPSNLTTLDPTQSTWQATTVTPTSESLLPTQDGGKCSE